MKSILFLQDGILPYFDVGIFSGILVLQSAGQIQLPIKVLLVYADMSEDDKDEVLKRKGCQSVCVQVSPQSPFSLPC